MTSEQQPLTSEIEPAPPSLGVRVRRALGVPVRLLGALFVPDRMMPRVVGEERSTAAFITIVAFALGAAWVVGQRIDVAAEVLAREDQAQKAMGVEAERKSERDLAED